MAMAHHIKVTSRTWQGDHGLVDFEDNSSPSDVFTMPTAARLLRHGDNLLVADGELPKSAKVKPLLQSAPAGTNVELSPLTEGSTAWVVVRNAPLGTNMLVEGDTVAMGRETLRICQIVTDKASSEAPLLCGHMGATVQSNCSENLQCRICLDGPLSEDPFVQPCKCSGSVANVHVGCLRTWVKTRMNLPQQEAENYAFKKPVCEMCTSDFPTWISSEEGCERLVNNLPKVSPPFIVLESASKISKCHAAGPRVAYHVVSLANKEFARVGRGRDCEVRPDDLSMSRWHATIRFVDGNFVIEDHQSKFGTFIAMRRPWTLAPEDKLSVKVGRSVLTLTLSADTALERSTEAPCSFSSEEGSDLSWEDQLGACFEL